MSAAPAAVPPGHLANAVVTQVVRRFGDRVVLDHLDLVIGDEELVVLLGPSGCGKSTLLRLLAGLDQPDGGTVEVPANRAIVFQADRLLPWQRVFRNVALGLRGADAAERARIALAEVGLASRERAWPTIDQTAAYYVASAKSVNDRARRAALADVLERLGAEFTWGIKHPDEFAQALSIEEGIPVADAKAVLEAFEYRITPVLPSDIAAEQQLGDAFLQAGQITTKVDVASIVANILPAGYDSSNPGIG